jgi:hypothetical protein
LIPVQNSDSLFLDFLQTKLADKESEMDRLLEDVARDRFYETPFRPTFLDTFSSSYFGQKTTDITIPTITDNNIGFKEVF